MRQSGTFAAILGLLAACGGEGVRHGGIQAVAGVGGGLLTGAGASAGGSASGGNQSNASGDSGHEPSGAAGEMTSGGSARGGSAGSSTGGRVSGTGGVVSSSGAAGQAGTGGLSATPAALRPTVNAFCAAARACCAKEPGLTSLDDCEASFALKDQTAQALKRGTVTLDAAGLSRCLAAYEAATTSCEKNSVLDACSGVVQGTRMEDEPCLVVSECAVTGPKACVFTDVGGKNGVCKAAPHGKAGDACTLTCRPNEPCAFSVSGISEALFTPCLESEGLFCDFTSTPFKCQAIRATGAACEMGDQCGSQGYCDVSNQTCKKRGQLGDTCGECIPSLSCIEGKCKSPPFAAASTCEGRSLGPY